LGDSTPALPTTGFPYREWRTAAEKWAETGSLQVKKQRRAECAGLRNWIVNGIGLAVFGTT